MMKLTKSSRAFRRATAVALAFALTVSVPVANDASAATKKVPTLSAKKKTLYVKGGTKSFTLKVKKNKAKKIVKTKWTTSKKSVAKISSKKKTSVKVTAVKKGTAKITAKVTYKVGKKTKTKNFVCKVTVKATKPVTTKAPVASTNPSAAPSTDVTTEPTADVTTEPTADVTTEPTADVTAEPTAEPAVASSIKVDPATVTFNAANKAEAVTLSAVVADQNGEAMKDQEVEWTSDNKDVAVKGGVVTLDKDAKDGNANVTAAVSGTAITAGAVVVIDTTAPTAEKAEVTDYKTITVPFSEEVVKDEKEFKVTVNQDNKENKDVTAELAEDGKSLVLTAKDAFAAADYDIIINGVADKAGNAIVKDTKVSVTKAESTAAKFNLKTTIVPAPAASDGTLVYVGALDQYGQELTTLAGTISVKAVIKGTDSPLTATVDATTGLVTVSYDDTLKEGKTIAITLTNTVNNVVVGTDTLDVAVVKNEGKGVATAIDSVSVVNALSNSPAMVIAGTADEPEFTLTEADDNKLDISAVLLDKFGYKLADTASYIKVVSSNTNVVAFAGKATATNKSGLGDAAAITTDTLKVGTATLRVYLDNDDTVSKEIKVTVKPVALTSLEVKSADDTKAASVVDVENNKASKYLIKPNTNASVKAADLSYEVTVGKDLCKEVKIYDGTGVDAGKVFMEVTPVANGLQNDISIKVTSGKISSAVTALHKSNVNATAKEITVDAFAANKVTVGGTATTNFVIKNINGEDITATDATNVDITAGTANVLNDSKTKAEYDGIAKKGVLTVEGEAIGNTTLLLKTGIATVTLPVTVVAAAEITTVELNKYTESIKGDTVADNKADLTKLAISAKDQYGNAYALKSANISIKDPVTGISLAYFKADGNEATGEDVVTAIAVISEASAAATSKIVVKVGTIEKNVTVTVKDARALKTLTATADYTKVVKGQSATVTLTGKDQYGKDIALTDADITATNGSVVTSGKSIVTPSATGVLTATFTSASTNATTSIAIEAVNPSAVDKVVFDNVVTCDSKNYDTSKYAVYVKDNDNVAATFKAYVGNTLVKVDDNAFTVEYYATSGDVKVSVNGGVTKAAAGKIEARLVNNLNTTVKDVVKEFNVSAVAPAADKATIGYKTADANGAYTVAATALTVKKTFHGENAGEKAEAVKITALDQYGQAIDIDAQNVKALGDDVVKIDVEGAATGVISIETTGQTAPVTLSVVFEGKQYTVPVTFVD